MKCTSGIKPRKARFSGWTAYFFGGLSRRVALDQPHTHPPPTHPLEVGIQGRGSWRRHESWEISAEPPDFSSDGRGVIPHFDTKYFWPPVFFFFCQILWNPKEVASYRAGNGGKIISNLQKKQNILKTFSHSVILEFSKLLSN